MFAKDLNKTKLGGVKYIVIQSFKFDASHNLEKEDFSYLHHNSLVGLMKCFRNHGHTYSLDVEWEGFPTDQEPMIYPFGELKDYTQTLVRCCDHSNLNEVFDFPTTLENVGNWFFKRLKMFECEKLKLRAIVLREGSNNRIRVENI
jgi:6-pyruvoyltetrahydropterin/6-carboxytetrahydropterin synthase